MEVGAIAEPAPAGTRTRQASIRTIAPILIATAAAIGARLAGPRFVDRQIAALQVGAIETGDGLIGSLAHFHKAKAARSTGLPVGDDLGAHDVAILTERLDEV